MSRYGEALDAMAADQRHQADLAADVASKYNPDQYALAINESSRLGVSAQLISDNPDAYTKSSKYGQALDAEHSPTTRDWLTNVDNAAVAQDDVESLSMMERGLRMIRSYADIQRSTVSGPVKVVGMTVSGVGRLYEAGGRYLEQGIRAAGGDWLADILSVESPWWVTPSEIIRRPGESIERLGAAIGVPEERQNLATDVAEGLGQLGAHALIQILTGPIGSAATLLGQGADIMGDRADALGASPEQTDAAVLMGASITALTERYGLDKLLNRLPPQIKSAALRQITDIAIGGGIEAAQEAVEGVLHNLTAKALLDPNAPIFEGVEREAMAAGGAGAIARAVINAITPGRQVSFADQDRETAEQVSVAAQASKLATRSPQKLEELVAAISQETGSEFAYVDAAAFRTLFQSDQEAADAAAEMTGSSKTYFEAAVSNSKMAIPLAKYVTKIAADKNSASLLDHVTFSPEGLTAAEAQMEREGFEGRAQEIAEREVIEARSDSSQAIYDDVLGQLLSTGMERSTAERNSALMQVVFRTLGQRTGIDAQELYSRYGLKVRRYIGGFNAPVDTAIDPLIDRLRAGDVPTQEQASADLNAGDARAMDRRATLIQLGDFLSKAGVDLKTTDNVAIKRLLFEEGGTRFDQSKPPIGKDVERFLRDNLSSKDWNRFEPIVSAVSVGLPEYSQSTADQWRDAVRSHPSYKTISVERIASRLREMGRGGAANLALELGARGVNVSFDTSKSLGSNSTYLVAKAGDKAVKIRLSSHADTGAGVRTGHDPNDIDTTPNHWRSALRRAISALGVNDSVRLDQSPIPQIDTPEFRRWFGESKVVDDEGKPLVVYHGTKGDFAEFQLGRADRRDGGWFGDGFYLTASQDLASSYAMRERDHSLTDRPANVMPVYVRMSNPYRINLAELSYDEGSNFTKKYGGNEGFRKWLTDNGYDGVIGYRDPEIAGQGAGFWEVVVFDPTQIKSAIGNRGTFDPNSPSILEQSFDETKRGAIQFGKDRQFTISLLEKADLSTFLHESGHFYLEVMADLAEDANAPQQVKDDFATIMKWMGVKDRASIKTEHHEQWARGFEAYLMEGKSPSVEMQTVFARFRAWLVSVYKALTRLNVTLTEDVRRVMDRLVATDEEITAAEESQNYAPIFTTAEQAGMSPEEWAAYRDIAVRAHQEAVEDMTSHAMSQLTREQKAWWKEERASMAEAVTKEVNDNPTYQALAFLQKGKNADGTDLPDGVAAVKLNRAALEESYGKEFIKRLPRGTTAKDGVNPEIVAGMFDFRSGAALVEALANARPKAQLIEMEVDARMREKYGDMLTDGSLAEQAMKSVHTEARSKVMAAELRALNKKRQEVSKFIKATDQAKAREQRQAREANPLPDRQEMGAIKLAAQRTIQAKKIRAIQPNIYRVAEARAARKAFDLAGKGRFEEAYQEKRRQILNHELYKEAVKARAEVDLIVEYMRKFGKKSTRERLGKAKGEYLAQIDAILERFDFSNVSNIADLDRKSLLDWVEDQRSKGLEVAIPDYVLNEARRTPYKELILAELQGLHDAVKNIDHLSRLKNKLLTSARKRDFDETVSSVVESIETHHERKQTPIDFAPGLGANIKKGVKKFFAEHTKMEFLFSWLDGEKELGPAWDAMFKPIADAENIEQAKMRDAREALTGILSKYSKAERAKLFVAKVHVPEVNANFTKASLLSVALNSGNQYNRDVMLRGYGWNDSQVNAILAKLDNRDWDVVEAIWGHVDSYWTDIAALQKDLTGLEPEKVEAAPFTAPNGRQIRGGYYPIKYDADTSERQMRQDEAQSVTDLFGGSFARIATKHGHTKARTDSGGKKVKLDLGVYTEHVTNVIHDLAFRRAVLDVDRIAQDDRVQSAIIDTAGREMYRQINPWLRSIAADYRQPMNTVEKVLNHARAGASIVSMGWKITTAVVQPLGYLQSIEMIGTKYAGIGLKEFYGRGTPKAMGHARDFVFERSEQMRNRMTTFDRDVRDQLKGLQDRSTAVRRSFFYLTGAMDMSVSIPTWLGAYRKAMDGAVDGLKSGDELAAIDFADSMVRKSQSAGGAKDLAGVQASSPIFKLFTTFYSYFNVMYNMMARRYGMARAEGIMKHTPELVSSVMLLWFMPAVLSELIAQRGPEEDEDWGEWFLSDWRNWALYPFQGLVGVRDVISAMGPFGYDGPAAMEAFRAAGSVLNIPAKILDEDAEITRSDVRAALLAASYWGHLPGRQLWITGEYLYAYMTGEVDEFSVRDALFPRPKD